MRMALDLAIKGVGHTSPNPMVGCVIVKDGRIIGKGYHEKCGELHAERNAIKNSTEDLSGATMYVTLEPCCHYGKTPPCTEAIIENKIKRVVVGCTDNNPLVSSKGIKILRDAGIIVDVGVLSDECRRINEVFFHYIETKRPYIVMKYAMTLDGKIATYSGDSKWISCSESREHVHTLRKRYKGIMAGIETVIKDDPMLNCRIEDGVDPVRIICDSHLRIDINSNIVKSAKDIQTIIATNSTDKKAKALKDYGIEVINIDNNDESFVDFNKLMDILGSKGIDSILVEGGGTIHGELLKLGLINKVYVYIAPKIVGGLEAPSPVKGRGFNYMKDALTLKNVTYETIGTDIVVSGYVDTNRKE
ncbi:MAG: bifunctional diaminohydroxyphosphoribosylaminopyrimidine deaminase/5-amino-6-(5-phosphoribosylamino)uracil reductase RibD [Lachnospiraceae bacterium]|nr:bifunctional diaminohydroxyphosphoribosylaminopyrimidine deaminase/5-amino-6-(5-phosphoribosylamino)uracil reductase RibD [Lachnospiraceae bacterium]